MKNSNKSVIEVRDLFVEVNGQKILDDVNFEVARGDVVAVIGPNGAGKTTLFKAMLGLIKFTGRVNFFGAALDLHLDKVSYVPQRFNFDKSFPLTVVELLAFSQKKKDLKKIDWALKEVGMEGNKGKLLGQLSGGQLQRALIARALLNDPEILFFDEPTAGIDLEGEEGFYQIIEHQNKVHNVTVLMISHEIERTNKFADKLICLHKGRVCKQPYHVH